MKCSVNNYENNPTRLIPSTFASELEIHLLHAELWVMVAYRRWQACINGMSLHRRNGLAHEQKPAPRWKGSPFGEVSWLRASRAWYSLQLYSAAGHGNRWPSLRSRPTSFDRVMLHARARIRTNTESREPLDHARCPNFSDDDKKNCSGSLCSLSLSLFSLLCFSSHSLKPFSPVRLKIWFPVSPFRLSWKPSNLQRTN